MEEEDEEGWETVQRGGRLRSRQSPSQKSCENLSELGSGGKKSYTRSNSVPNSSAPLQRDKRKQGSVAQRSGKNDSQNMRAISEQQLPGPRERLDSKGSEKENNSPGVQKTGTDGERRSMQIEKVKRDIFGTQEKKTTNAWTKKTPEAEDNDDKAKEVKPSLVNEEKSDDDENFTVQLNDVRSVHVYYLS